ncbi:ExbD/TolR family protein [Sphingomonas lenta]|uniref:Biopolymer transporter ExbD n=1 Tax=Sphingomonas lenta TaxID=1141887 RepID=A0A2A2SF22_9SPHN|nr:biopolymer transporter ExbD [Sphingomonas lenta]PAX07805.1 biopolymer transporter ExbD [Sphingomonas lenta]
MRRNPAFALEHRPMGELNITPLIDVMLVLLVMFILAVPAATHEVEVDLPQGGTPPLDRVEHRLELLRDGSLRLDGVAMTDSAAAARLRALADDPKALLVFRADGQARYERADQVLAEVKRAGVTRLGFEGLAAFRQ